MNVNRRDFVKAGVAASMGLGLSASGEQSAKRPNVLYVFGDQHRAASLPAEPFSEVQAPGIAAVRRANFSMDTCVSNYPLCSPYRAIMMSGKYPSQTGVVANELPLSPSEFTVTKAFKASGYRVGYVGKWHLRGRHDQHFSFILLGRSGSRSTTGTFGKKPTTITIAGHSIPTQAKKLLPWAGALRT